MVQTGWLSDPIGRINNLSLAPSTKNTLQPMFEALMNSIHAIEEKFGKNSLSKGRIDIEVTENKEHGYTGFTITDNGIGLNEENMTSFRKSDSMKKVKFGGKGVGRLLWLKVADKVEIKSKFVVSKSIEDISFDFVADPKNPIANHNAAVSSGESGTIVKLSPLKTAYSQHIPAKLDTIAVRTVAHFINYFVNIDCPLITLFDSRRSIVLFDKFTDEVVRDKTFEIPHNVDGQCQLLSLNCFMVPKNYSDDEKGVNGLFFGANGRAVTRFDMDGVIGLKAIDGKYALFGYLEGDILNESVNDTRTEFSLDEGVLEELKRDCIAKILDFLKVEIDRVKTKQIETIITVRNEHLRFFNIAKDPKEIAEKLSLNTQKEEDIFVELSRRSLRQYKRKRKAFAESKAKNLSDVDAKAKEYVAELQDESLSSLAEYIYKRKLILDIFEEKAGFSNIEEETSHYEKVVHELICPLGSSSEDLSYDDHNLWIVDDRLAFYSYFNSDKQFKSQAETVDKRRPDITLFDLGMGFEKGSSMEPITIVEFKRPRRDDYTMSDNPFLQVQDYVDVLKEAGAATKFNGNHLRTIEKDTPFMCKIVADDTPSLRKVMDRLGGFHKKAGSKSYYKWDSGYKIFIELSSYSDLIEGAKARHTAFFDKLGISQ